MDFLLQMLLTVAANALVTFGVIKATLRFLEKGIDEAKSIGKEAHLRIDTIILNQRRTA